MEFKVLRCPYCGKEGNLERRGEFWYCGYCGNSCTDDSAERAFNKLAMRLESSISSQVQGIIDEAFMKKREEEYFNLRSLLWEKTHVRNIESATVLAICREIKKLEPHDFLACFYEVANSAEPRDVVSFLNGVDVSENEMFVDLVIEFMLSSLTSEYIMPLGDLIERAYKDKNLQKFKKYATQLESEAQKVESGIYSTLLSRDVFIAYSSKDIDKVIEIMTALEDNGITCFVAMRNLQHGRGAVDNYTHALHQAIRNSRMLLFVSSKNSRNLSCHPLSKELAYVKELELASAPPEYRNDYSRLPEKYKKPRIEYRLDNTPTPAADLFVREFFANLDYCESVEKVISRVADYKINGRRISEAAREPEPQSSQEIDTDKYCTQCGALNAPSSRFCLECGNNRFEKNNEKFCTVCKAKNLLSYRFCLSCGGKSFVFSEDSIPETVSAGIPSRAAQSTTVKPEPKASATESSLADFEMLNGKLVAYRGNGGEVIIPETVTSIGDRAFQHCKGITSVTIGDSVTSIGNNAFRECTDLKSLKIGKGVTYIAPYAFYGCIELTEIYFSATAMRDLDSESNVFAFSGRNTAGISITVGKNVTVIPACLFYGNTKISSVEFEKGSLCRKIGYAAFRSCEKSSKVIIPAILAGGYRTEFGKLLNKPEFIYV